MGVLCSCTQFIIYPKSKIDIAINPKIEEQKNTSKNINNYRAKYKEKHLTKDSTLVNYSNNNSPDNFESNKNLTKNNLTDSDQNNSKKKYKNKPSNSNSNEKKNELKNDISHVKTFDKVKSTNVNYNIKITNIHNIHNIHTMKPNGNNLSPETNKNKKLDKFLNIEQYKEKNMIGFRADSFNIVDNPIKNILSNKSNNNTKNNSPKKIFITNKTIDSTNKQEGKNFKLLYSIKTNSVFGEQNQKLLYYYLHKHFMFIDFNEEFINYLMDHINIFKYNNKEKIFKKGELAQNFYIIKQGTVALVANGKVNKKLNSGNTFGEISLFQKETNENNDYNGSSYINNDVLVRNYTAISYGKTELFVIKNSSYNIALKGFSSKLKTINYNEEQCELKEENKKIIENYKFFKYLDNNKKALIVNMSKIFHFKESDKLLSISNYSKREVTTLLENKPYFRSKQNIIFPIKGEIIELSENLTYRRKINKNDCSGIIPVLCPEIKNKLYAKTSQKETQIIYISEEILIEVLGPNYSSEIMKYYYFNHFSQQNILSIFLNVDLNINNDNEIDLLKEENKNKISESFNAFSTKEYDKGEVIYNHQNIIDNKKIIFPIINSIFIFHSDSRKKEIKEEKIILDEIFNDYNPDFNIRSEYSWTIVLEAKWKNIYDYFYNIKNEYEDIIKRFNIYKTMVCFRPLYSLTIKQLIDFGLNSEIQEFRPKEIILKNQEKNNNFFLILKGRVKVKNPITNKTVRVYDEGNCFGEYYILSNSELNKNYISDDYSKLYCIDSRKFYEYLKISSFNDYIKSKMLLEDEEMQLNDFYYITYLGKGTFGYVCLVHNELSFYAIKAINREAAEKGKNGVKNLVNEKKCMIAIDHPFIVNFVKTMKKKNWVFILEEYIKGKNFEDYLMVRKHYKNIKELIFYGGCFFLMLKYLTKNRICHRDIKPRNVMIGIDGYLKLIDFGCARKIKFFSKTVLGTPNYISPEVLKGIEYSFSCDYWSVGVCCYLIYFGKLPFGDKNSNIMQIYNKIIKGEIQIPKDCPIIVKELIEGLLNRNPGERINNFDKIKELQLFKDFDWDNLLRKKLEPFLIPVCNEIGVKANLNNLASPFDKFIQNEWVKTSEMHLLKIKNKEIDNIQEQFENEYNNSPQFNNNQEGDNCHNDNENNNKLEFSKNWYDYF